MISDNETNLISITYPDWTKRIRLVRVSCLRKGALGKVKVQVILDPTIQERRAQKRADAIRQRNRADWLWRFLLAIPGVYLIAMQITSYNPNTVILVVGMIAVIPFIVKPVSVYYDRKG